MIKIMSEFKNKVAVITGAATGIGRGIAEKCVQEGMKVVLADVEENTLSQTEKDLKARGAEVLAILTDVTKIDEVENLAQKTLDNFGAVHMLCNNAGVGFAIKSSTNPWESSLADWKWIFDVNFFGIIHGIHVFVPIMLKQDIDCYIVNTASMAGLIYPTIGTCIYSITKHAVIALSESLKIELQRYGAKIKVSALCPGFVSTKLLDSERNRPKNIEYETKVNPEFDSLIKAYQESIENGISPKNVAETLFQAIRGEKFYIPTDHHRFLRRNVKNRMEAILQDLQKE